MERAADMKKKVGLICILLLTFLSGCGINEKKAAEEQNANKDDAVSIGVSFDSFIIERWQRDRDVFVSTAKEMGATVNVQNANGDVAEQKSQIDYLINKNVDVIVVVCIDSNTLSEEIKRAKEKGIKVICYDRLVKNSNADLYISFDNKKVGSLMGECIGEDGTVKNVIMLCGSDTDSNVPMVEEGFLEKMKIYDKKVIDTAYMEGWNADLATKYVEENADLINVADAIMCGNDDIATHVIRSLAVSRKAGKILVVGQDADLAACQHIVEGTQKMTVYKPVEYLASQAARCAIALAKGENLQGETINDGTFDIPYIALEPIMVNRQNIDEVIIDGGFHLKEDVYLNVSK